MLRWNGQAWQHTTIPNAPDGGFNGVTALSPTAVYAVGQAGSRTLVARWNGSTWNQETTPSPGSYNALADAASTGTGTVWAVGMQVNGGTGRTLAIRTGDG